MRYSIQFILLLIVICSGCGKFPKLGGGYALEYSGRGYFIQVEYQNNTIVVADHVVRFGCNSKYILIEQKPIEGLLNRPDFKLAIKNSKLLKYWIIDKAKPMVFDEKSKNYTNVYGPFTLKEYINKREDLQISPEVELINYYCADPLLVGQKCLTSCVIFSQINGDRRYTPPCTRNNFAGC